MTKIKVNMLDWAEIGAELDREGYAVLPAVLEEGNIRSFLAECADRPENSNPGSHTFNLGFGSTWQLLPPLPNLLDAFAKDLYQPLARIANRWQGQLGLTTQFPPTLDELRRHLSRDGLKAPQATLTRLLPGEHEALHQTPPHEHSFRLEVAVLLSEPGSDFTGGEFVMTEQRPRMQSRPIVVPLKRGDALVMAAAHRPFKGSKGIYRVNMKHAISRVLSGQRLGAVLSFHDAQGEREDD
jgi:uncharacterized protein